MIFPSEITLIHYSISFRSPLLFFIALSVLGELIYLRFCGQRMPVRDLDQFPETDTERDQRDAYEEKEYPYKGLQISLFTSGKDDVEVGRIRKDYSVDHGLNFWLGGDQIRKGAALNALQIAEYMIKNDML